MKCIFAAVARDAELRQAEDADAGVPGVGHRAANARGVAVPVQWGLIENGSGDADEFHGWLIHFSLRARCGESRPVTCERRPLSRGQTWSRRTAVDVERRGRAKSWCGALAMEHRVKGRREQVCSRLRDSFLAGDKRRVMPAVGEPGFFVMNDFKTRGEARKFAFFEQVGGGRFVVAL